MANFRPAGFSDDDSDSDEYGFYEKPAKRYYPVQNDAKKKLEIALQDAIMNGNTEEVRKIIQNDLQQNANFRLESGWTPLMHACFHAQDTIVKLLLELGADPNIHSDSLTPIMTACSNSSANNDTMYNIITDLIEYGCILNTGDKYGQTPLMRAISSGRVAVVEKLLENDVNIEMRDQQGWTALFWSVHHNQPEILEMLIDKGARITEVDRSNRKPIDIANAHDFTNIVEILNKFLKIDEDTDTARPYNLNNQLRSWHDYYPGLKKGEKITYQSEIPHLLYGMNCEHLIPLIEDSEIDLRTFLLLQEKDMIEIGVDMPFERKRLKAGLRNFHIRSWKLNSVAGLYARKMDNYGVLDCLTTLGTHLQQLYVLEATLQYTLREYNRVQNQLKFEPPDSPLLVKMKESPKKIIMNINNVRRQIKNMKQVLIKINKSNPQQANLIKEKSFKDVALSYTSEFLMLCSVGLLVYQFRNVIANQIRH